MAESLARIHATLRALSRRELRNLALQAVFGALAAWLIAWSALTMAVSWGLARATSGPLWLGALVLSGALVGAVPLRRWRRARDARLQALRVEALRPELRGALLTVIDREATPRGSPALLARLAERAATAAAAVKPSVAHPAAPAWRLFALSVASFLVFSCASLVLPVGPFEAVAALRVSSVPTEAAPAAPPDGPKALVGDITLRYLYPTYTGREPLEVPNSNGEIHAPPGTRVEIRARTGEVQASAQLVAYDLPPVPVVVTDGRQLAGELTVAGAGSWRFVFPELPSPDYAIVPDPDLPPDVAAEARQRVLSVALDEELPIAWTARDDFGVTRVVVEIDEGGKMREVAVRTPPDVPRELAGGARMTPKDLGLIAGDSVKLRIGAWDNDAVSGSKAGYSGVIEVEVLGAEGRAMRQEKYRKLLRDALVLVIAEFLVEPAPVVQDAPAAAAWATRASARYEAFDALVREAWAGAEADSFDATVLRALREDRRALFGFADGLGAASRISESDLERLATLQGEHITTVENAILMFDQVIRAAAMADVQKLVEQVSAEASELRQDFEKLDRQAALARLDQLDRLFRELARKAAALDEGAMKDFVNERADRADRLMDEIRKAIREGRMEDAAELMDRLAQTMEEMAQHFKEMQDRQQGQQDQLAKAMEALEQELAKLEQDQQRLRERNEAAQEKYGPDMQEAVNAWEEVEKLAKEVTDELAATDPGDGGLPGWSGSAIDDLRSDADGLLDSARARDLDTALPRADQVHGGLSLAMNRVAMAGRRQPSAENTVLQRKLEAQQKKVVRIRQILEKMSERQVQTSPALQQELQRMAAEQQQLSERADQTQQRAGQVAGQLPMDAPGLEEGAQRGAEQSERAAESMREGDAMGSSGGQRAAEEGFRQAREALKQAKKNMQEMQQASRPRQGGAQEKKEGKQGEGDDGGGESDMNEDMPLPAPEAFKTPEEYRRALLEGMSGDVPEEYKALNRRYYEELVRQ